MLRYVTCVDMSRRMQDLYTLYHRCVSSVRRARAPSRGLHHIQLVRRYGTVFRPPEPQDCQRLCWSWSALGVLNSISSICGGWTADGIGGIGGVGAGIVTALGIAADRRRGVPDGVCCRRDMNSWLPSPNTSCEESTGRKGRKISFAFR